MPKKSGWGVNEKVVAAREREQTKKTAAKEDAKRKADDALWEDEKNNKFLIKQKQEEAKRQAEAAKRAELKALKAKEEAELSKSQHKEPRKITAAQIFEQKSKLQLDQERKQKAQEEAKTRVVQQVDILPNMNMKKVDLPETTNVAVDARSLTHAVEQLSTLSLGDGTEAEKHPERRMRAAYAAFEENNMPIVKSDNPTLKYSQLKEKLWDMWQKSPENPVYAAKLAASSAASSASAM